MATMVKSLATVPTRLIELIHAIVERDKWPSASEYIRSCIMSEILSPEMYATYRLENGYPPVPVRGPDNETYAILSIDDWMEKTNFSPTSKLNFTMPQDMLDWLEIKSKEHNLSKAKLITILIMKDLAHEHTYLNYRSIFDKVWLYKYFREVLHCVHEDDPDQDASTIPDDEYQGASRP